MRGEAKATSTLIDSAVTILQAESPMTVRQCFYRLVGTGQIENTRKEYQRVSRLLTIARRDGRCEYEWIVDRLRSAIEALIEPESWNRHLMAEKIEKESILDFANKLARLPKAEGEARP